MFVVSFFALCPPELPFKFMDSHINASVSIFTCFSSNKNLAALGSCNYFNARTTTPAAIYNNFNLIDAIIVLGKLGNLFLCMFFDRFGYFDMFTTDCNKQNYSP